MKYVISKFKMKCPKCGKLGILKNFSDGSWSHEHKRTKTEIKIMGKYVMNVEGCFSDNYLKK